MTVPMHNNGMLDEAINPESFRGHTDQQIAE